MNSEDLIYLVFISYCENLADAFDLLSLAVKFRFNDNAIQKKAILFHPFLPMN